MAQQRDRDGRATVALQKSAGAVLRVHGPDIGMAGDLARHLLAPPIAGMRGQKGVAQEPLHLQIYRGMRAAAARAAVAVKFGPDHAAGVFDGRQDRVQQSGGVGELEKFGHL